MYQICKIHDQLQNDEPASKGTSMHTNHTSHTPTHGGIHPTMWSRSTHAALSHNKHLAATNNNSNIRQIGKFQSQTSKEGPDLVIKENEIFSSPIQCSTGYILKIHQREILTILSESQVIHIVERSGASHRCTHGPTHGDLPGEAEGLTPVIGLNIGTMENTGTVITRSTHRRSPRSFNKYRQISTQHVRIQIREFQVYPSKDATNSRFFSNSEKVEVHACTNNVPICTYMFT